MSILKNILKAIGYSFAAIFGLAILYVVLFTIGSNGKCIACSTKTLTDTVTGVFEGGVKDAVFSFRHHKSYYINRGLENGLNIDTLIKHVVNRPVTISYASPTNHINHFVVDGKVLFSELDD